MHGHSTTPLTTLLIALPEAAVRQSSLSDIQGDHWIQLLLPGKPSSVRSSLGIPDTMLLVVVNVYDPLGWDGYHFALRGTLAQETLNADTAPRLTLRCETEAGTWKDFPLAAWERLVMCPGTDLYVRSRWTPTDGTHTDMRGLEQDTRKGSLKEAYRGLKLLHAIERRGGRPQGSREWTEAEFRRAYPDMYQLLLDTYASQPKRYEVAEALSLDRKTFHEYLKAWHLSFPPL